MSGGYWERIRRRVRSGFGRTLDGGAVAGPRKGAATVAKPYKESNGIAKRFVPEEVLNGYEDDVGVMRPLL
jgi:hypothetical protein